MATRTVIAAASGFAASLLGVSFALGQLQASADPATSAETVRPSEEEVKLQPAGVPTWATADFPRNENGQSYGSDARASDVKEAPDLVAVIGDSGVQGFVRKAELYGPTVSTPEEALKWEERIKNGYVPVLDVYDLQGEKVVDTFTLEVGTVSYEGVDSDE